MLFAFTAGYNFLVGVAWLVLICLAAINPANIRHFKKPIWAMIGFTVVGFLLVCLHTYLTNIGVT